MVENWIIPCSVKFFDVVSYLTNNKEIVWRRVSAVKKNDNAYVYIGAPYGQIKYLCKVVDDNVGEKEVMLNQYAVKKGASKKSRFMKLKLIYEYERGILPYTKLKENGLGQVQIQARIDRKLQQYIDSVNSELGVVFDVH